MRQTTTCKLNLQRLEDRAVPTFGFGSAFNIGGVGYDFASSVAVDDSNSVYVAGHYNGSADFDPSPTSEHILTAPGYSTFVAKYSEDGAFQWVTDFGDFLYNAPRLAARNGALYASTYGGGSVARLDPANGDILWDTNVANGGRTLGVAIDSSGNALVTGRYGASGVFVSKLNSSGAVAWTRNSTPGTDTNGLGIAVDNAGNVYATGAFEGSVTFGTKSLSSSGAHDVFLWKLNSSGNHVWAGRFTSTGDDRGTGIAVDGGGNVVLTGWFGSAFNNFNPGNGKATKLPHFGNSDIFVAKLASASNGSMSLTWAKSIGGAGVDSGQWLALDSANNIYTTGSFGGPVDFNPGSGTYTLAGAGGNDAYVSKLSSAGNFVDAASMGGSGSDGGRGIAVDGDGNVITVGVFQATADFDPTAGSYNLTSNGIEDFFVAKLTQGAFRPGHGGNGNESSDDALPISFDQPRVTVAEQSPPRASHSTEILDDSDLTWANWTLHGVKLTAFESTDRSSADSHTDRDPDVNLSEWKLI